MSLSSAIVKNTALLTLTKFLTVGVGLIGFTLMARYLGPERFGQFGTASAFLQFFGVIGDLGLSVLAVQMFGERPADKQKIFENFFALRILSAVLVLVAAVLVIFVFPYSLAVKVAAAVMAPSFFFSALIQILTTHYQAKIKMLVPACADVVARLVQVGGIALAVWFDAGLNAVLISLVAGNLIQSLILALMLGDIKPRLGFDWQLWRIILSRGWPIAVSIIFNLIYLKTDTIILSLFGSEKVVGLYSATYRILGVLVTLPMMFMGLTLASFATAWSQGDRDKFRRYTQKTFDALILATMPLVLFTMFIATPLMTLIAGPEYAESGPILGILIIATGIIFIGTMFGHLINVIHQQRIMIWGYALGAVIGLTGYLIFIPTYSYWAAAWMTVVSEAIVALAAAYVFTAKTGIWPSSNIALRVTAACLPACLWLWWSHNFELFIQLPVAATIYVGFAVAFGAVTTQQLKNLLRKPDVIGS